MFSVAYFSSGRVFNWRKRIKFSKNLAIAQLDLVSIEQSSETFIFNRNNGNKIF